MSFYFEDDIGSDASDRPLPAFAIPNEPPRPPSPPISTGVDGDDFGERILQTLCVIRSGGRHYALDVRTDRLTRALLSYRLRLLP